MGRRVLHDHHAYGTLSVADILIHSSNIGMAKIGERLTNAGLYEAAASFGFGRRTGIGLPGELPGMLRPLNQWNDYSTGSVPMGQEIAATPLQVITAHAALANGGRLISPRLVMNETQQAAGPAAARVVSPASASVVSQVVDRTIAEWLVRGPLTDVVRRGTGKRARLQEWQVFGKTGTAQKIDLKSGGYSAEAHVGSFLCGAPADDPRVLVLVVVDEPTAGASYFGGTVAAPSAARILEKSLIQLRP
jgi:cell division protein FtsI/penicillin-binding protein 2